MRRTCSKSPSSWRRISGAYEDLAQNFAAQFLLIGHAMNGIGPDGMWDEEDGFYYDVLRLPDETATRLKVRSMVQADGTAWMALFCQNMRYQRMPELQESFTRRDRGASASRNAASWGS